MSTQISHSPTDWIREHTEQYLATGGSQGHIWNGVPTLLLTTRGRRSGELRRTPLIYGRSGDDYVLVASYAGAPTHPAWYLNLLKDSAVRIQVGDREFTAIAREATTAERDTLWAQMTEIYAGFDEYQNMTERHIPVVLLSPTSG